LNAAGPGARIEVHIEEDRRATIEVIAPAVDGAARVRPLDPPIDESFICPGSPRC
jgi:hypothetical protein